MKSGKFQAFTLDYRLSKISDKDNVNAIFWLVLSFSSKDVSVALYRVVCILYKAIKVFSNVVTVKILAFMQKWLSNVSLRLGYHDKNVRPYLIPNCYFEAEVLIFISFFYSLNLTV